MIWRRIDLGFYVVAFTDPYYLGPVVAALYVFAAVSYLAWREPWKTH